MSDLMHGHGVTGVAALPPRGDGVTLDDVEPCLNPTRSRIITGLVTGLPVLALGLAAWQLWNRALRPSDLVAFASMYALTGLGITVGFHRLLCHRSFKTSVAVRATLAILGSAAIEGPVIAWVADHRKHHAFADREGDPHSPHVEHGYGLTGALRGLAHAHLGWLFIHAQRGRKERYARDLIADPVIRWIDRTFVAWAAAGFLAPFIIGAVLTSSWMGGVTGMLWGGLVRVLILHHVTYSVNSLCHFFGRRPFRTEDESRDLAWLAPFTFGEAWHNAHHAFPTSARHGLGRRQLDISAGVIRLLERTGLAWDVIRIPPRDMAARRVAR